MAKTDLPFCPKTSKAFASSSGVGGGGCGRTAMCRKGVLKAALHLIVGEREGAARDHGISLPLSFSQLCTRHKYCRWEHLHSCLLQLLLSRICLDRSRFEHNAPRALAWHHSESFNASRLQRRGCTWGALYYMSLRWECAYFHERCRRE